MRVVVGSDDTGAVLDAVVVELATQGANVELLACESWPLVARRVAEAVAEGRADMGILACWTGTGTSIMANKVRGVRAALCWEPWIAEGARRWNDANVLVLSSQRTSPETAREIISVWLGVAAPDPDEAENIAEIARYEQRP